MGTHSGWWAQTRVRMRFVRPRRWETHITTFCSQDPTPAVTPETPPVISTVVHATDEEKLAVTSQKWTCMTVDLEADKQDYPQPSDLSTFVNETKFNSPTEGKQLSQPDPHPASETTAPREQKARKETSKPGNCCHQLPSLVHLELRPLFKTA